MPKSQGSISQNEIFTVKTKSSIYNKILSSDKKKNYPMLYYTNQNESFLYEIKLYKNIITPASKYLYFNF